MPNEDGGQTTARAPAQNPSTRHDWETSNSTTQLFLGAARKPWMTGPGAPPAAIQATGLRNDDIPAQIARPRGRPRKQLSISKPTAPTTITSSDVPSTSLQATTAQLTEASTNLPITLESSPSVTMIDETNEAEDSPAHATGNMADVAAIVYDQALPAVISTQSQVEQSSVAQPGFAESCSEHPQVEEPLRVQNLVGEQRSELVQDQATHVERPPTELRQVDPVHALHKASSAGAVRPAPTPTPSWDGFRPPEHLRSPAATTTPPQTPLSNIARTPSFSIRNGAQPMVRSGPIGAMSSNPPPISPVQRPRSDAHLRKRTFVEFQEDSGTPQSSANRVRSQGSPALPVEPTPQLNPYSTHLANVMVSVRSRARLRDVDEQRVVLLQEACLIEDLHYLVLHQIYCMVQNQGDLLQRFQVGPQEYAGLRVLELILVPNINVNRILLTAFANFPRAFQPNVRAMDLIDHNKVFLRKLAMRWNSIRIECLTRGYPTCAHELETELSVYSPIMQKTLFNSLHRQISGNSSPIWQSRAIQLFLQNQRDRASLNSRGSGPGYPTLVQSTQTFGQNYLQAKRMFETPAPPASTPVILQATGSKRPEPAMRNGGLRARGPQSRPNTARLAHQLSFEHMTNPRFVVQPQTTTLPSQSLWTSTNSITNLLGPAAQNRWMSTDQRIQAQQTTIPQHALSRNVPPRAHQPSAPPPFIQNNLSPEDLLPRHLLPRHGYQMVLTTHPNPDRLALHQAHLRDPEFKKIDSRWTEKPDLRLYQFVERYSFISGPFTNETTVAKCDFDISQEEVRASIQHEPPRDGLSVRGRRIYASGAIVFRVRCSTTHNPSQIGVRTVMWPSCFFMSFNTEPDLEVRRKSHWGRDLPADITHFIQAGQNTLTVSYHPTTEEKYKEFYFVVERVRVCDHDLAKRLASRLSADKALASLTSVLRVNQDDDLAFADPHVSIDLIDPFMATIWHTPVRGKDCKHRECFDHEAFLQSRPSYLRGKEHSNSPTDPDKWACPICGLDARPASLVIDEFLLQVRAFLEIEEKLDDARAILLMEDGTWEVKKKIDLDGNPLTSTTRKPTPAATNGDAMDVDKKTANGSQTMTPLRGTPDAGTATEPIVLVLDDDD